MGKSKKKNSFLAQKYSWKVVVGAFVIGYLSSAMILYFITPSAEPSKKKQMRRPRLQPRQHHPWPLC